MSCAPNGMLSSETESAVNCSGIDQVCYKTNYIINTMSHVVFNHIHPPTHPHTHARTQTGGALLWTVPLSTKGEGTSTETQQGSVSQSQTATPGGKMEWQ